MDILAIRLRRRLATVLHWCPVAAMVVTGGCFAYRPSTLAPDPGSRVRIVLGAPAVVTTIVGDTSRRTYPGVLEVSGVLQAASRDTLALRLGELRTATGAIPALSHQVAMVPTASVSRIEQRRFQAGRTALTAVGLATLALTVYIVLLIAAITRAV
jgi:hypothetical protein